MYYIYILVLHFGQFVILYKFASLSNINELPIYILLKPNPIIFFFSDTVSETQDGSRGRPGSSGRSSKGA